MDSGIRLPSNGGLFFCPLFHSLPNVTLCKTQPLGAFKNLLQEINSQDRNRSKAFSKKWEGPFSIELREEGTPHAQATPKTTEEVNSFNDRLKSWGLMVKADLSYSAKSMIKSDKRLSRSIKNTFYYDSGEIYRLGFSFLREGIFLHKGVGRGYNMQGDEVVKTSKTAGFNRHPKPWFNPVLQSNIAELEDIIHDYAEKAILNTLRIYIR